MSWERKLVFVGYIFIFVALAVFLDLLSYRWFFKDPFMTPGQIAFELSPLPKSLATLGWEFFFDLGWWLVVVIATSAIVFRWKALLRWLTAPGALALALLCEGIALRVSFLTPGLAVPRIWYTGLTTYRPIPSGLAVLIDTACWLGLFFIAYKFVPYVRHIVK